MVAYAIVFWCITAPYLACMTCFAMELDPMFLLHKYGLLKVQPPLIIRGIILLPVVDCLRLMAYCICSLIIAAQMGTSALTMLRKNAGLIWRRMDTLKLYIYGFVLYMKILIAISISLAALLGIGMGALVFANLCSIRFYERIPMPWYLLAPVSSFLITTQLCFAFWFLINLHEYTVDIKRRWVFTLQCNLDQKWFRKRIRSVQFVRMFTGIGNYRFFYIKRSTRNTFFWNVNEKTIAVVMFQRHAFHF